MRSLMGVVVVLICTTEVCAELVIQGGNHYLVCGVENSLVPIYARGSGELVEGLNLYLQVGVGGNAPPVITGMEINSPGCLFYENNTGPSTETLDPRTWMVQVTTADGSVPVDENLIGWININTVGTGFGQSFALRLQGIVPDPGEPSFILDSDFAGVVTTVLDGVINIAPPGDANKDGKVNDLDASILASNWLMQSGAVWEDGDFNCDGQVSDIDASIMAANWQHGVEGSNVPEPSVLMLAGQLIVGTSLAFRRWPRSKK
jgi:hypothetical protein